MVKDRALKRELNNICFSEWRFPTRRVRECSDPGAVRCRNPDEGTRLCVCLWIRRLQMPRRFEQSGGDRPHAQNDCSHTREYQSGSVVVEFGFFLFF